MKHLRKFSSVSAMETAIARAKVNFLGLAYNNGEPQLNITVAAPPPDPTVPFYIEDVSGSDNTISIIKFNSSAPGLSIQKSLDGVTWESMGSTSATAITATVPANGKLYLRCRASRWGSSAKYYNYFNGSTGNFNVGGNIMSLLYGNSFNGQTEFDGNYTYTFYCLFKSAKIVSAANLLLPATILYEYCYSNMFVGCASLTTAPELPAETLARYCYYCMFSDCSSLTATPTLPATILTQGCYAYMFYNCSSLTIAPELPATTLVDACYGEMFRGCTNLNYVKCLATNPGTSYNGNWLVLVAATGTFVRTTGVDWPRNNNGVPSGWTVQDASE